MENLNFEKYIGLPASQVKTELENFGYIVTLKEFSKPKNKVGEMLVVKISKVDQTNVLLLIADFKIDI